MGSLWYNLAKCAAVLIGMRSATRSALIEADMREHPGLTKEEAYDRAEAALKHGTVNWLGLPKTGREAKLMFWETVVGIGWMLIVIMIVFLGLLAITMPGIAAQLLFGVVTLVGFGMFICRRPNDPKR